MSDIEVSIDKVVDRTVSEFLLEALTNDMRYYSGEGHRGTVYARCMVDALPDHYPTCPCEKGIDTWAHSMGSARWPTPFPDHDIDDEDWTCDYE